MINHSSPPGHNRDYFTRPRQGDRHSPGYGVSRVKDPRKGTIRGALLLTAMFWVGVFAIAALSGH